jgi:glucose/arabinose dehydrogenase
MMPIRCVRVVVFLMLAIAATTRAADPFAENVRSTPPRSPEEERSALHVPQGFEVQLVACEPDIAKPMNLAFDARGRLWVSVSREYPFPAPATQPGRDSIKIFEDFDPATGRARKITTFADNLNIPIGLYPYRDGVIAYSIPKISFYRDTDNDGRCDRIEPLIGDFGYLTDTHGMASNFRRGFDGLIYACHGFNNRSIIKGADGKGLELNSGNTFRFRIDGKEVQQFTWGQTNPFGLSFDECGNAYTSDSHSKPIYQLLRGGYYEGIGKTHDGLGFAPAMMQHTHGSTALSGLCVLADSRWPKEFVDNILVGNVITSRLNRDRITFRGSTPAAQEQSDFIRSHDPWFRPNNTILGPDGALYVADFYNRIIGHYEVPLDHPGRDRERGRIWRIVHRDLKQEPLRDLTQSSAQDLIALLDHPNLPLRMLATDQLSDRIGADAGLSVRETITGATAVKIVHALWVLFRLDQLTLDDLQSAAKHTDPLVRIHTQRILAETHPWTAGHRDLSIQALDDSDALAARCAADALAQHPRSENIQPLLALLNRAPAPSEDTHLRHAIRIALKQQLTHAGYANVAFINPRNPRDAKELANVSLAVQTPDAARFLASHLDLFSKDRALLAEVVRQVAKLSGGTGIDGLVTLTRERFADDSALQLELLHSIREGVAQHGGEVSSSVEDWATQVAGKILSASENTTAWTCLTLDGSPAPANIFSYEPRRCTDKSKPTPFLSSLPAGETQTGILRSPPLAVPSQLTFFVAGHNGFPTAPSSSSRPRPRQPRTSFASAARRTTRFWPRLPSRAMTSRTP